MKNLRILGANLKRAICSDNQAHGHQATDIECLLIANKISKQDMLDVFEGRKFLPFEVLCRIAEILNISVEELIRPQDESFYEEEVMRKTGVAEYDESMEEIFDMMEDVLSLREDIECLKLREEDIEREIENIEKQINLKGAELIDRYF